MSPRAFDPSAAAGADSGLYGLPLDPVGAAVHVLAAPFDATASYRKGAWKGPAAILRASRQVDLFDLSLGRPYEAGIWMAADEGDAIGTLNRHASRLADGVIAAGGDVEGDAQLEADLAQVNGLSEHMNRIVYERTRAVLDAEKLPALVGGDHSTPFGAIRAAAELRPGLGILHFDAHADLRVAYEGFSWSHASIMDNVLRHLPDVAGIVQVGIRDLCEEEHQAIGGSQGRVRTLFDRDWQLARFSRQDLRALVRNHLRLLPSDVWISFDIDGLDPSLCPQTGTPVPGGLDWSGTHLWLEELVASGRRVVGLDLNEVNPGPDWDPEHATTDSWDAIVAARLLYRLIGTALATRQDDLGRVNTRRALP